MSGVYRFKYVYYGDKPPDEVVVDGVTCRREGISEVVEVNVGNVHVKVNDDGGGVKVGGFAWYVYIVLCLGGLFFGVVFVVIGLIAGRVMQSLTVGKRDVQA